MQYNKRLFIKYFLLFAIGLISITIAGKVFPAAGRVFEAIGDLMKASGLFFGLAWIVWFKQLEQDKKNAITALKTSAISFADIAIGVLALIQFNNIIALPNSSDFWMITAFDYSMFLFYIYQYCQLSNRKLGND
jgi:hypothetical protein